MDDARDQAVVRVIRRRDGTRELRTSRPLESLAAAFDAIAKISLAR